MTKLRQYAFFLILALAFISASYGRTRPELTQPEVLELLAAHEGPVKQVDATFPRAVTNTPPLTSMGPTSVTPDCFNDWRAAMNELRQEGFLTSFRDAEEQIAVAPADLTAKGKPYFRHLASASVYGTVRLIPEMDSADVRISDLKFAANGKRAQAEFRVTVSEPFRIMRASGLFADGCGADMDPAVLIDSVTVSGHAHFRFRKGRWQVERVLLGEHRADDE